MTTGIDAGRTQVEWGVEREFGFVPTFLYRGRVVEAGTLATALRDGGPLTLDHHALNLFLRTDLFFDGGTPFREVRRVSPPPVPVAEAEMSREQAIDGYIDLFRQAVARRITPGAVVALSGGRDSRHILLELCRQGMPPAYAITIALRTSTDLDAARQLAEAVGVNLRVASPNRSIAGARLTVRATDFMSLQHAWFFDVARARDARAWWDGIAGDVLSAGLFVEDWNVALFEAGRLDELADRLVRPGRVAYFHDQSLFPRQDAVDTVRRELALHVGAANPVGSFYFWNRTRVNIAASAFGLLRLGGQVTLAPYLDRDLWRFLSSVPLRHVRDHQLHDDVIRRAYPAAAHLQYARKRAPGHWYHRRQGLRLLGHLATQRPTRATLGAALRTVRSLVQPARAADVDWIVPTWVYGDEVERARQRAGTR
jgi:Asparagine synthase (glutamine-hydrolyzing)